MPDTSPVARSLKSSNCELHNFIYLFNKSDRGPRTRSYTNARSKQTRNNV